MKQTLISLIHTAMGRCQSKQNWIMAAVFGLNSFFILNSELLLVFHHYYIFSVIILMAALSSLSIWHAALAHLKYAKAMRDFLKSENDLPEVLVRLFDFEYRPVRACLGSITYIVLVLAVSIGSIGIISYQVVSYG